MIPDNVEHVLTPEDRTHAQRNHRRAPLQQDPEALGLYILGWPRILLTLSKQMHSDPDVMGILCMLTQKKHGWLKLVFDMEMPCLRGTSSGQQPQRKTSERGVVND